MNQVERHYVEDVNILFGISGNERSTETNSGAHKRRLGHGYHVQVVYSVREPRANLQVCNFSERVLLNIKL